MKDIRHDGGIDIHERHQLPERVEHRLDPIHFTGSMEDPYITISQSVSPERFLVVPWQELVMIPKLIPRNFAFGAFAIERTRNQYLFRVVANKTRQNRMAPTPDPIPTHHWQTHIGVQHKRT